MRIRVLIENKETPFFNSEHGLSLLIEYNNKKILFDTGKTDNFIKNAKKLNIKLDDVDYIVLSHAHYDHTTGLTSFINEYNYKNNVYVGNDFSQDKYELNDDKVSYKYIGTPFKNSEINNLIFTNDYLDLGSGIKLLSNFKLVNDFEDVNPKLFRLDNNKYVKDLFSEEQVLTLDTPSGIILIVGCSHVGICNIISQTEARLNKKIRAVIGGFHLYKADEKYVNKVIDKLKEMDIELVSPMHCSRRDSEFKKAFLNKCQIKETGDLIIIDEDVKAPIKLDDTKLKDEYAKHTTRNIREGDRN